MSILEHLEKHGLSRKAFGKKVGAKEKGVSHWITGIRRPKPTTAMKIEWVTKGEVTLQDIYGTSTLASWSFSNSRPAQPQPESEASRSGRSLWKPLVA
jgi:DNA-binding transcriptional regulator YdaS (Cro superfamily)